MGFSLKTFSMTPLYRVEGLAATIEADRPLFEQLSHHWRKIDRCLASGDNVVIWLLFGGTLASTGRDFEIEVCDIFTVKGEKITALQIYGDFSAMLQAMQE